MALVTDNGIERGMTALFAEAERVKRFGFTASELDRQKANMRLFLERASIEEATWESDRLADGTHGTSSRRSPFRASATSTRCTSASSRRSRWLK